MRLSTQAALRANLEGGFSALADRIRDLEQAGLDIVWVPEAYGFDAPTAMGYLAARTERLQIGAGILPIYSRTPTLLAQTAAGLDAISGGRAILGLGASGPQVIEGFHGVPYDRPVQRTREIVEICRRVWRREVVEHHGPNYTLPLPPERGTGLGKPLKLMTRPLRSAIPIYLASLGARSVALTAEVADGWLPIFFVPEKASTVWGEALKRGTARRAPDLAPLEIVAGGPVAIGEGLESLRDLERPHLALYVGGMGARGKNFYNDLACSYGFAAEAAVIQDLYLSGRKQAAAEAVPAALVEGTTLIGPRSYVAERLAAYKAAGVTVINALPIGPESPVRTIEQLRELIEGI
jgi:F420-dependent oxidoreductase-like protein